MSQNDPEQELEREDIGDDRIRYRIGDNEYMVLVVRKYRLHGHFGEFTTLDQVERVIRKMEADQ